MPQITFFDSTPTTGKLVFSLTLPGRLPSWNEILGMEHWSRAKLKGDLAASFEYGLRRAAQDSSMTTISVKNTMLTYCATLASYQATAAERRALRSSKKKLDLAKQKKSSSKSLKPEKPLPF